MKKVLVLSLVLLFSVACSSTKTVPLTVTDHTIPGAAKLTVGFFKTKSKGFDLSLRGTSTTGKSVVIRKDEITCGRGETLGNIRGIGKVGNDPYIMLPAESYKEFHVYCGNKEITTAAGEYYVKIKNVYEANIAGQPDKAIASDIMLELK